MAWSRCSFLFSFVGDSTFSELVLGCYRVELPRCWAAVPCRADRMAATVRCSVVGSGVTGHQATWQWRSTWPGVTGGHGTLAAAQGCCGLGTARAGCRFNCAGYSSVSPVAGRQARGFGTVGGEALTGWVESKSTTGSVSSAGWARMTPKRHGAFRLFLTLGLVWASRIQANCCQQAKHRILGDPMVTYPWLAGRILEAIQWSGGRSDPHVSKPAFGLDSEYFSFQDLNRPSSHKT